MTEGSPSVFCREGRREPLTKRTPFRPFGPRGSLLPPATRCWTAIAARAEASPPPDGPRKIARTLCSRGALLTGRGGSVQRSRPPQIWLSAQTPLTNLKTQT